MFTREKKPQGQARVSAPSPAHEPVKLLGLRTGDLYLCRGKTYPRLVKASCLKLPAQFSGLPKPCKAAELLPPEGSISVKGNCYTTPSGRQSYLSPLSAFVLGFLWGFCLVWLVWLGFCLLGCFVCLFSFFLSSFFFKHTLSLCSPSGLKLTV